MTRIQLGRPRGLPHTSRRRHPRADPRSPRRRAHLRRAGLGHRDRAGDPRPQSTHRPDDGADRRRCRDHDPLARAARPAQPDPRPRLAADRGRAGLLLPAPCRAQHRRRTPRGADLGAGICTGDGPQPHPGALHRAAADRLAGDHDRHPRRRAAHGRHRSDRRLRSPAQDSASTSSRGCPPWDPRTPLNYGSPAPSP